MMIASRIRLAIALGLAHLTAGAVADTVDIREWLVPWENAGPTDPYLDARGRVWFISPRGDFVGNFSPDSAEFNRYDLRKGTAPAALLVDGNRNIWYASGKRRHIGMLNPGTGRVTEFEMPDRQAKDLRTLVFDRTGDLWFTAQAGNFVGRLRLSDSTIDLVPVPTRKSGPFGIAVNSRSELWVAASQRNALIHVDPVNMSVTEIATPHEDSRLRRLVVTSDDRVWYADYALGSLGRYDPRSGQFSEWPMPGGTGSRPFGMTVDRDDRIWVIETGRVPNRLIAFDTKTTSFLTETDIPSGAGSVSQLFYAEWSGEIWFGTESNYVGRARVH